MSSLPLPQRPSLATLAACVALAGGVVLGAAQSAGARERVFLVRLDNGRLARVKLDVADGTPLAKIPLPGRLVREETATPPGAGSTTPTSGPGSPVTDGSQSSGTPAAVP